MSTYTRILYHIIFSTKNREKVLSYENHEKLFKYIWGVVKKKNCFLYEINGVKDHIHILLSLHPAISLSDLVKDIKVSTSLWIKENNIFEGFIGWQAGYGAFTYSMNEKDNVSNYIKGQKEHHRKKSYLEEVKKVLDEAQVEYDEKYL